MSACMWIAIPACLPATMQSVPWCACPQLCFADPRIAAQVENKVGGTFDIFSGAVVGTFTKLQEPDCISLDWRFRNWEDAAVSKVNLLAVAMPDWHAWDLVMRRLFRALLILW